ncbi:MULTISPECIES: baseplate J/gp47 family protein [Exiguobacterium]|uniref:baseplate J/gp47 family protein n=1 Tax=Exiguobacterium TaxID=33986 RepID=UPI001AE7953C|nr:MULTISPECIES: baseplate J/gp47 family protein [Exiguobacterium]MCT4779816.1 baseplate J/gp47 family protein [Exiguobacterium soli]
MALEFETEFLPVIEPRDVDDIHADMLQVALENDSKIDIRVGEPVWDATRPTAIIVSGQSIEILDAIRAAIPQLSFGTYLDEHAKDLLEDGRKPGVQAVVPVTLTSFVALTVPKGTSLYTGGDLRYTLDEDVVLVPPEEQPDPDYLIPGEATSTATASDIGIIYNVVEGAINLVDGDLKDLVRVTNTEAIVQGVDQESDNDLKARMRLVARNLSGAGNLDDYEAWALEATGITKAKVFRADPSPGSVTILVASKEGMPTAEQVAEAQAKVSAKGALIANNIVLAPTALPISIAANITIEADAVFADVEVAFEQALQDYLAERAFSGDVIRYAQLFNLLIDQPGMVDVENLLVNGGTANITPGTKEIATLGTVTLT